MKKRHTLLYTIVLLLGLTLITGSCVSTLNISDSYDREALFQSYQTYAWYSADAIRGEGTYNTLLDERIKDAVESALVKEGMRPAIENPDVYLAYDIALETENNIPEGTFAPGFGYGYSYWYGYRFNYGTADFPGYRTVDSYTAGTIVIDIIDAGTNTLVWRGRADAAINTGVFDNKNINRVITSIMAQYPPAISKIF